MGVLFLVAFSYCDGTPSHVDKEIENIEKEMYMYASDLGNYTLFL